MSADLIREQLREIDERVKPTIGPTFGSNGKGGMRETREGRISADDFNALMGYAMAAVDRADEQP